MISLKYESFDINSKNPAFNLPNATIVCEPQIKELHITGIDTFGKKHKLKLKLHDSGKGWILTKPDIDISDADLAKEYFTNCVEDNGYDNNLINELSTQFDRPIAEIKSIISSFRTKYTL